MSKKHERKESSAKKINFKENNRNSDLLQSFINTEIPAPLQTIDNNKQHNSLTDYYLDKATKSASKADVEVSRILTTKAENIPVMINPDREDEQNQHKRSCSNGIDNSEIVQHCREISLFSAKELKY
jgi:hypothetical protein